MSWKSPVEDYSPTELQGRSGERIARGLLPTDLPRGLETQVTKSRVFLGVDVNEAMMCFEPITKPRFARRRNPGEEQKPHRDFPRPNGLRLSGERSRAERVRCSRGVGAAGLAGLFLARNIFPFRLDSPRLTD